MKDSARLNVLYFSIRKQADEIRTKLSKNNFSVEYAGLVFSCLLALLLILFFLVLIKPLVFLRADILMWGETEFVGNMIKLNIGMPLYTNPSDSSSMIYNPAAYLLTYSIAWLSGQTKSVVAFRLIQIGYVVLASLIATVCARKLHRIVYPNRKIRYPKTWFIFTFLAMFLVATSPNVNTFVYSLHVDALSLLISIFSFWTILNYLENENRKNLLLMAICPALGFLAKQFLISWIGAIFIFLLILNPKKIKSIGLFLAVAAGLIALAIGGCYLIWGDNYLFWTFELMGGSRKQIVFSPDENFKISLARGFDHLARVWLEIFVGIIGSWLLLRDSSTRNLSRIVSVIVAWLAIVGSEVVSSGAGWDVLYHFGPGAMIGAIFMFAALPKMWESTSLEFSFIQEWSRAFVLVAVVVAIFMAWHVVPTGNKNESRYIRGIQSSPDIERYLSEIENEFEGMQSEKVLLGAGNWIYLRHDVLQKDRAVSLADQPFGNIYKNFEVTNSRIRSKTYQKILLQNFDSPNFLYEWNLFPKPTGFREALLENYVEIKVIPPPKGNSSLPSQILLAGPVSVFIPRN